MKGFKKWAGIFVVFALASLLLTACFNQAKTYASECGLVIGKGYDDAHRIKHVIYPGGKVNTQGDEAFYRLPCNARNYLVTNNDGGDRKRPSISYTAASKTDARLQEVLTYSVYFGLNQNEKVLKDFLPFCEKYTCYSTPDTQQVNFAAPGWNGMLKENFSPALDRASNDTLREFGPDIDQQPALWPQVGAKMATNFMREVKQSWAAETTDDFFCGDTAASRTGKCTPVQIVIDSIAPADAAVVAARNSKSLLNAQASLNAARVRQAKALYGPYWAEALKDLDLLQKCKDTGQVCTMVFGSDGKPSIAVSLGTKATK